jgi:hypothetical protein
MRQVFAQPGGERTLMRAAGLQGVRSFVAEGTSVSTTLRAPPGYDADVVSILDSLGYNPARRTALAASGACPGAGADSG